MITQEELEEFANELWEKNDELPSDDFQQT